MNAWNLHKLPDEARNLIALMFTQPTGWTDTYMVEVRLDDPVKHLLEGGDGLHRHGGNRSRCYAHHHGASEWEVVHFDDEEWKDLPSEAMAEEGHRFVMARLEAGMAASEEDNA